LQEAELGCTLSQVVLVKAEHEVGDSLILGDVFTELKGKLMAQLGGESV